MKHSLFCYPELSVRNLKWQKLTLPPPQSFCSFPEVSVVERIMTLLVKKTTQWRKQPVYKNSFLMKSNQCFWRVQLFGRQAGHYICDWNILRPQFHDINIKEGFTVFSQWFSYWNLKTSKSKLKSHQFRFIQPLFWLGTPMAVQWSYQRQGHRFIHARKHLPEVAMLTEDSTLAQCPQT